MTIIKVQHKTEYGLYLIHPYPKEPYLLCESDNMKKGMKAFSKRLQDPLFMPKGADIAKVVDLTGNIIATYKLEGAKIIDSFPGDIKKEKKSIKKDSIWDKMADVKAVLKAQSHEELMDRYMYLLTNGFTHQMETMAIHEILKEDGIEFSGFKYDIKGIFHNLKNGIEYKISTKPTRDKP